MQIPIENHMGHPFYYRKNGYFVPLRGKIFPNFLIEGRVRERHILSDLPCVGASARDTMQWKRN